MLVIDDSANPSDLRSGSCYLWTTPLALRLYNICSQILIWFWRVWRHGRHGNVWVLEKLNMRQQTQETHCFKILFGIGYISTKQPKGRVFPPKIRSYGSRWNTISSAFFFKKCNPWIPAVPRISSPGPPSFSNLTRRSKEKLHKHTQDSHVSHVYSPLPGIV